MCVSCGCGQLNENHGDNRNITLGQIEQAASAANISVEEVCENIEQASAGDVANAGDAAQRRDE